MKDSKICRACFSMAWNRSTEQARATALAMPLLQKANRITVLTVIGGTEVPASSADS
jgi:hypothetical protein